MKWSKNNDYMILKKQKELSKIPITNMFSPFSLCNSYPSSFASILMLYPTIIWCLEGWPRISQIISNNKLYKYYIGIQSVNWTGNFFCTYLLNKRHVWNRRKNFYPKKSFFLIFSVSYFVWDVNKFVLISVEINFYWKSVETTYLGISNHNKIT